MAKRTKSAQEVPIPTPQAAPDEGLWEIRFFFEKDGSCPAKTYLLSLEEGERKRFAQRLKILRQQGMTAGQHIFKKLKVNKGRRTQRDSAENLYELRLENSPHNPRFLCCLVMERRIYLLHGFSKTGQPNDKVPDSEKRIANNRREALLSQLEQEKKTQEGIPERSKRKSR